MTKVLCIGHAAYDITLPVSHYPKENTKNRIHETVSCGGGAAANGASLLAKWGIDTYFAGVVGKDAHGQKIRQEFAQEGVHLDFFEVSDHFKTTTSYIVANRENGSRTIIVSRTKQEEMQGKEVFFPVAGIFVDGEEPAFSKQMIRLHPEAITVLDAGNKKEGILELAPLVQYLVCSKDFAEEYCEQTIDIHDDASLQQCIDRMITDFHNQVIITLGSAGSFTKINGSYHLVPSISVKALDSTGAGDIYHGALLYFLLQSKDLLESMRLANITGAISTTRVGGKYSIPSLEEVLERGRQ